MLESASHEIQTLDPAALDAAAQHHGNNENRGTYRGLLAKIALAAGHMLTGNLKPIGSYREIFNPITSTREYRARKNWIDQLL